MKAGAELEVHLRDSLEVRDQHAALIEATDNISLVLTEIVAQARDGMVDLNGTLTNMKHSLRRDVESSWMPTLWMWIERAAVHILRGSLHARLAK